MDQRQATLAHAVALGGVGRLGFLPDPVVKTYLAKPLPRLSPVVTPYYPYISFRKSVSRKFLENISGIECVSQKIQPCETGEVVSN